jgi:hypothetical protein
MHQEMNRRWEGVSAILVQHVLWNQLLEGQYIQVADRAWNHNPHGKSTLLRIANEAVIATQVTKPGEDTAGKG